MIKTRVEVVFRADFKNDSNFYPSSVVGSHYGGAQMILPENSDFWPDCMLLNVVRNLLLLAELTLNFPGTLLGYAGDY